MFTNPEFPYGAMELPLSAEIGRKKNQNTRIILGSVLLTLLIVQNSRGVTLSFVAVHIQLPLFLIIAISAVAGFGIGRLLRMLR